MSVDEVRNAASFQRRVDHGHQAIELHAWRRPEGSSFATFIYEKAAERLLRHFTGTDENEVIRAIASLVRAEFIKFGQGIAFFR